MSEFEATATALPAAEAPVDATVAIPGSKSVTNRALVLAALSSAPSTLTGVLRSRDTDLMIAALRSLGIGIVDEAGDDPATTLRIIPAPLVGGTVDVGLAGTLMRFLPPLATLATGDVTFDGDERARQRPLAGVLTALRSLGADVDGSSLPCTVHGTGSLRGGEVSLDASASSQFVSGLLLSAARFDEGLVLRHIPAVPGAGVPSRPHIDMTIDMLSACGVTVETPDDTTWVVQPQTITAPDVAVEPDLSNATPFLAAAAVTGGRVTVPHWPARTTQAGDAIRDILADMGCGVTLGDSGLTVTGPRHLDGIDLDLSDIGELTPTVAALCALAESPSHLHGIAHLRGHETDRLAALHDELTALGGDVVEESDGLVIRPAPLSPGLWHSYEDHRMATAGAILSLVVPGITIDNVTTTAKTLPGFEGLWRTMLGSDAQ